MSTASYVLAIAFARIARETLSEALARIDAPAGPGGSVALTALRLRLDVLRQVGEELAQVAEAIDEDQR